MQPNTTLPEPVMKSYKAYISQAEAAAAPTPRQIGTNTIGNIIWTKATTGQYIGTLNGAFPEGKTVCPPFDSGGAVSLPIGNATALSNMYTLKRVNNNTVNLLVFDNSYTGVDLADITANELYIEINVFK